MRTEILNFLQSQNLGVFTTTNELPWVENGVPLYIKNLKKVYVSQDQVNVEPLVTTLDALIVSSEETSVTVYLACDAKQTPPNLDQVIQIIRQAKDVTTIDGVNRRDVVVNSTFEADVLVTELEFRFTKII
jgi:hypothetical protein